MLWSTNLGRLKLRVGCNFLPSLYILSLYFHKTTDFVLSAFLDNLSFLSLNNCIIGLNSANLRASDQLPPTNIIRWLSMMAKVWVWSRSIADWDLQRETLWEMMERLAIYFLLITLASLAEADFTVSSKRDMRWVGVLDHLIIFLTPATLPPGGVGSSLSLPLMVSLVQPTSWFSSVSQPSAQLRSSGLEIWREIARYRSSVFIIIIWCFHF